MSHGDLSHLTEVFQQSVEAGAERGAVCVMVDGNVVLDLHGGMASPDDPWCDDTLACCFSVSKGVISLLAHVMIDRGLVTLETRVADIWSAFAQGGKEGITLLDVLTHRAGLPAVDHPVSAGDLYDWDRMLGHLERSAPVVPACAEPVYHNMTYGHLLGAILCKAAGVETLTGLLREMVTGPLAADFQIGLDDADIARCATLTQEDPGALFVALRDAPDSLFAKSMAFFDPMEDFNTARWRRSVIGSGSGHATARGLATLYGQFIWDGGLLSAERRTALREHQADCQCDRVLGVPLALAQGVERSLPPAFDFGPGQRTVGHWGAGGAQAFADPNHGISFAYVTGHMASGMGSSPRASALVAALYRDLEGTRI